MAGNATVSTEFCRRPYIYTHTHSALLYNNESRLKSMNIIILSRVSKWGKKIIKHRDIQTIKNARDVIFSKTERYRMYSRTVLTVYEYVC